MERRADLPPGAASRRPGETSGGLVGASASVRAESKKRLLLKAVLNANELLLPEFRTFAAEFEASRTNLSSG